MFYAMLTNWKIWAAALGMAAFFYACVWAAAIICVSMGGTAKVCGL